MQTADFHKLPEGPRRGRFGSGPNRKHRALAVKNIGFALLGWAEGTAVSAGFPAGLVFTGIRRIAVRSELTNALDKVTAITSPDSSLGRLSHRISSTSSESSFAPSTIARSTQTKSTVSFTTYTISWLTLLLGPKLLTTLLGYNNSGTVQHCLLGSALRR